VLGKAVPEQVPMNAGDARPLPKSPHHRVRAPRREGCAVCLAPQSVVA
jgi:hypothetical protein